MSQPSDALDEPNKIGITRVSADISRHLNPLSPTKRFWLNFTLQPCGNWVADCGRQNAFTILSPNVLNKLLNECVSLELPTVIQCSNSQTFVFNDDGQPPFDAGLEEIQILEDDEITNH